MIAARRLIRVDGKVRTDPNFPAGFGDVITIEKTNERFRLLYDVKGRFTLVHLEEEEAKFKLAKVVRVDTAKKASIGHNPFQKGQLSAIPYLVTHDGRTIRYPDPNIRVQDTVKINLATGKIDGQFKLEVGNTAMVTRGANVGRIGQIGSIDKHPGGFDIVHLKDARGHEFATRISNVFVIGTGKKEAITVPRGKGIKLSIQEERDRAIKRKAKA
jgi:small subunit ribosomal protein S4e